MDRMACVELPTLPLQLLLRLHPEWRGEPVALIEREAPHAAVLCVNAAARRMDIAPGMRYSVALGLCAKLCAGVIEEGTVAAHIEEIAQLLRRFSPGVEACTEQRGTFWLDTRGLTPLYASLSDWARAIETSLREAGFTATIAVGFRRFSSAAIARALAHDRARSRVQGSADYVVLFERAEDEQAALLRVPLEHVGLEPAVEIELDKLGVQCVGDLVALSAGSLLRRFGAKVHQLHRRASGDLKEPLTPQHPRIRPRASLGFELPEIDRGRLIEACREILAPLLATLERRGEIVVTLELRLVLDDARTVEDRLSPAVPTRDLAWLVRLLELRLETLPLKPGVVEVEIELATAVPRVTEPALFAERPRRDPQAAAKAIDALSVLLGQDSVVHARLHDAHLPEARFAWAPGTLPARPAPRATSDRSLVRRIFHAPHALAPLAPHASDGWLLRGVTHGCVQRLMGPHSLSGGWWRSEVERDYHFAELKNGELYWIFFDKRRRRWFLQGIVS
jgi:protein ImuB